MKLLIETDKESNSWLSVISPSTINLSSGIDSDNCKHIIKCLVNTENMTPELYKGFIKIYEQDKKKMILEIPVKIRIAKAKPLKNYIGIDFGTTNSVIVLYNENDEYNPVKAERPDGCLTPLIPSILGFDGSYKNYKIGWEAIKINNGVLLPDFAISSLKRLIKDRKKRRFFGKNFSIEEMVSFVLKKLVEIAEKEYAKNNEEHCSVNKAILTTPINFDDKDKEILKKACELAGINNDEKESDWIIDEPIAAAFFYFDDMNERIPELKEKFDEKGYLYVLVVDYGGGSLDVSVIQIAKEEDIVKLYILSKKGNNEIGGDMIDLEIMNKLLEKCKEENPDFADNFISMPLYDELNNLKKKEKWNDSVWEYILTERDKWKKAAEDLKIKLSESQSVIFNTEEKKIDIFYVKNNRIIKIGKNFKIELKKEDIQVWLESYLKKYAKTVEDSLFDVSEKNTIDYVFHTGRSSLLPVIRNRIKELFPNLPDEMHILDEKHLKICVAWGAALFGSQRDMITDHKIIIEDKTVKNNKNNWGL